MSYNTTNIGVWKELLEGKVPKTVVEEEPKVSTKDQLYREQVDEYNVSFLLFICQLSVICQT